MRALVTGADGFVGRHFVEHLRSKHWQITRCDIKDHADMLIALRNATFSDRRYDLIVHAAAKAPHRRGIDEAHATFPYNVMLDAALFEWAIRTKQRHVVYLSSSAVYPANLQTTTDRNFMGDRRLNEHDANTGEPFDDYGRTKLIGERMAQRAREAGVGVTVTRTFSGYGADQSTDFPFRAFIDRAQRAEDPFTIWGSATQVRDWIHIDDVIAATMTLVEADVRAPVNVCTGVGTTMRDVAALITKEAGYDPKFQVDDLAPLGVHYRVGSPTRLNTFYTPKITIEEGVARAFRE